MTTLPSMRPTGWFQVGWSADIAIGDEVPLHYFGRDLVAYRGLDGRVTVMDAHCRHLGANLAYGGCVVEDGIQCPFHGWVWNSDGRNVRIASSWNELTSTVSTSKGCFSRATSESGLPILPQAIVR